jgi:hypothetical protein
LLVFLTLVLAAQPIVMHYWLEHGGLRGVNFPQRTYHRPFLAAEFLIKRSLSLDRAPRDTGVAGILDGRIVSGFENTIASSLGDTPESTQMINGLLRTILFRMKAALAAGKKTASVKALTDAQGLGSWPADLESVAAKPGVAPATAASLRSTAKLAQEVLAGLASAPRSTAADLP